MFMSVFENKAADVFRLVHSQATIRPKGNFPFFGYFLLDLFPFCVKNVREYSRRLRSACEYRMLHALLNDNCNSNATT